MKVRFETDKDGKVISVPDQKGLFDMVEFNKVPKVPQHGFISGIDPYDGSDYGAQQVLLADEAGLMEQLPFPKLMDEMKEVSKYYANNLMVEKKPAYLAIDPGKFGGLTVMCQGKLVFKSPMPLTAGDNLDLKALYDLITSLTSDYLLTVLIEDVHSIFGSSAGANFTFGYVCGAIEAVIVCCRLKYIKVQPKTWQKEVWNNADKCYKPKRPDQKNASVDTKPTSLNCARRLFPDFDFRSVEDSYYADNPQNRKLGRVGQVVMSKNQIPNDGIIDSALMCEYARIKNL